MKFVTSSTALAALLAAATPVMAQTAPTAQQFDVPAGALGDALSAFAQQSRQQLLYPAALASGRRSPGVRGAYEPEAALAILLDGSGLSYRRTRPNVFVVYDPSLRAEMDPPSTVATLLDEVVVTGSYLRGADSPSPVTVLSADALAQRGRATVADALAALPQNFTGSAYEGSAASGADRSGVNVGYATGLNLRGLGADATLVLVNSRRVAGTGGAGDFADVSSIPSAAVERVDVLLDGASALYGADAIGGVVNIILKDRFDGFETRMRVGGTTDGGAAERLLSQTGGWNWSSGSLALSYEYYDREELRADQRSQTASADLRAYGGSDWRETYATPGNIMAFDLVAGGFRPAYAIPAGQDGSGLQPTDLVAGGVNLSNQNAEVWTLPHQTRHSLFAALRQDLWRGLTLDGDVRWSDRRFETHSYADIALLTITDANPHFVSPDGSASSDIAYSFAKELGAGLDHGRTETFGGSLGLTGTLEGWNLSGYLSGGQESVRSYSGNRVNQDYLAEALGLVADNPDTPFDTAVDGFFNPYGDPAANSAAMRAFIGSGFADARYETAVASANLRIDGTILELPGGPLRLAAGLDYRTESFDTEVVSFFFGSAPAPATPRRFDRSVAAAFVELRAPLVGPHNALPGIRRLEVSLAGRTEDYDDVGSTTKPKLGLLYAPFEGLLLRGSYGESFRAPTLTELNSRYIILPTTLNNGSGDTVVLMRYGGNPTLRPETATSLTAGFIWTPPAVDRFRLEASWFRTEFTDRIGLPASEYSDRALIDPALAPFVTFVTPGTDAGDLALVEGLLADPANLLPGIFPAASYGAVVDARYVNAAALIAEGADVATSYRIDAWRGALTLEAAVTYLETYDRKITPTSVTESLVGQPHFPAKWRGRIGGYWRADPISLGLSAAYVGGSRDPISGRQVGDWLTFDGQVRYDLSSGAGPDRDLSLSLNVVNLLNEAPPFYDAMRGIGYDAANTNVLGRQVSFQLTKRW